VIAEISALEKERAAYRPRLPAILGAGIDALALEEGAATTAVRDAPEIRARFPRSYGRPLLRLVEGPGPGHDGPVRAGIVLSGGQAPGGHNVIAGLFDGIRGRHAESRLFGFRGGPKGIFSGTYDELTADHVDAYRNTGGFDMIGSGRDKIESEEQLEACRRVCESLGLHALVIVGGDDSNTNAAVLAESFLERGLGTAVLGVPKTIDRDMMGPHVETSFGFDTATRVYSELIGNLCRDARSAAKYWHFIKLMGRNASHVTLECGLQTHANIVLIGEEVEHRGLTLQHLVDRVADVIRRRAEAGRHYGICLVPEGLIEFIPEIRTLIAALNELLSAHARYFETIPTFVDKAEFVNQKLDRDSSYVFSCLPQRIQQQLLLERDAHGNVQVSRIDTEQLLIEQVRDQIEQWRVEGTYPGKFQVQSHFFGYEGRCAQPSNFDADYAYALGHLAAALGVFGETGYLCGIENLAGAPETWRSVGVPLTSMMQMESRKGSSTPVIGKALVRIDGLPFRTLASARRRWEVEDDYVYPGPIQYFGPPELCCQPAITLALEGEER
jgi:pyrophosphate--fructose-6-phosphate 1-phosphotransferase